MNKKSLNAITEHHINADDKGAFGSAYERAFIVLAEEVENKILRCPDAVKVVKVTDLCSRYAVLLNAGGVDVTNCRRDSLKVQLQKRFSDKLTFFRSRHITDPEMVTAAAAPQSVLLQHAAESLLMSNEAIRVTQRLNQSQVFLYLQRKIIITRLP